TSSTFETIPNRFSGVSTVSIHELEQQSPSVRAMIGFPPSMSNLIALPSEARKTAITFLPTSGLCSKVPPKCSTVTPLRIRPVLIEREELAEPSEIVGHFTFPVVYHLTKRSNS